MKQWKTTMIEKKNGGAQKVHPNIYLRDVYYLNFYNEDHYIKKCQLLKEIALYTGVINII